jgi:hypothetical protein
MLQAKEFQDAFRGHHRKLFVDVCLRLIAASNEERIELIAEPEEFIALSLDTCDLQKSKIAKTQAMKLVESIVYNVDGALSLYICFLT